MKPSKGRKKSIIPEFGKAIPTEYNGVTYRSRLEAQCALLFDRLHWYWEYEPKSFLLRNGVSFTPDFYIDNFSGFWECRGYDTKKGTRQIDGFREKVRDSFEHEDSTCRTFAVLYSDKEAVTYEGDLFTGMIMIVHCRSCGWTLASIRKESTFGMNYFGSFCSSCYAPMDSPTWKAWDGKAQVTRVVAVTASKGRVLLNGIPLDDCPVEFFPEEGE